MSITTKKAGLQLKKQILMLKWTYGQKNNFNKQKSIS